MINKNTTKRTKGKSTNNIIRDILKKYYVSTQVFDEFVKFLSNSLNYNLPEMDLQAKRALKWEWEPWEVFDLTPFYKQYSNAAAHNIINPDQEKPNWLSLDTFNRLKVFMQKEIPAKEILDNFDISYPTLKKRLDPFFDVKTKNKGKAHIKYYTPKVDVFIALVNYYALENWLHDNWNYFKQIYDLFKRN